MDVFDISAISGAGNQTVNLSELPDANDISCFNASVSQTAELSLRLTSTERNYRQFRVETDRQLALLKADVYDKDERAHRLELQLADTSSRADTLFQSLNEEMHRLNEGKKLVEAEKLKFLQLNGDLSADLERKRNELANVKMQLSLADEKATHLTTSLEKQATEFRQLYDKYNMQKRRLLEALKMKAKIESLESENDRLQHEGSAKFKLSNDLQKLSEVEAENYKLKSELKVIKEHNANVEVLREKVGHLTTTLETSKIDLSRLSSVETENKFLKEKLQFLGVAADAAGPQASVSSMESGVALIERIRNLEASARVDTSEIASLREALQVHRDANKRLEEELEATKSKIASLEMQTGVECEAASQARSQLVLCSIHMVEKHLGFTGSPFSAQTAVNVRVPTQIKELESAFEVHKGEVTKMRNELLNARQTAEFHEKETESLKAELNSLKEALETKTSQFAALEFEHRKFSQMLEATSGEKPCLDDEEAEANRGRIVHFKDNPADMSHREWLTDEAINLERHRRRHRAASMAESTSELDTATSEEIENMHRRIDALERACERKEKDLRATREMAAFSVKELSMAVTHLLGFELNLNAADKIYSLRSAYAEPTELFLFKPRHSKGGSVSFQILETEMARRFKDNVQLYIVQHQSIPAFLASVTTELISRQTLIA